MICVFRLFLVILQRFMAYRRLCRSLEDALEARDYGRTSSASRTREAKGGRLQRCLEDALKGYSLEVKGKDI